MHRGGGRGAPRYVGDAVSVFREDDVEKLEKVPLVHDTTHPVMGGDPIPLIGSYNNPILKPEAAAIVKKLSEISEAGKIIPDPSNQCAPYQPPYAFSIQVGLEMVGPAPGGDNPAAALVRDLGWALSRAADVAYVLVHRELDWARVSNGKAMPVEIAAHSARMQ